MRAISIRVRLTNELRAHVCFWARSYREMIELQPWSVVYVHELSMLYVTCMCLMNWRFRNSSFQLSSVYVKRQIWIIIALCVPYTTCQSCSQWQIIWLVQSRETPWNGARFLVKEWLVIWRLRGGIFDQCVRNYFIHRLIDAGTRIVVWQEKNKTP